LVLLLTTLAVASDKTPHIYQKGSLGQAVDYRVDGERLYIRRDNGKEYKCKIEGQKSWEDGKTVAPPSKP
jgi:hypothetical protein